MAQRRTSDSLDSLREYAQRRTVYADTAGRASLPAGRRVYDPNNLGPSEDVMERRRRAHRHHVSATSGAREGSGMAENLILLAGLAASIYALYRLCIYLLSQGC